MKFIQIILSLFLICQITCISRALYLNKEKCFYDNYYNGMNLVMTYKILDTDIKIPSTKQWLYLIL
jgi:hypothetical protein